MTPRACLLAAWTAHEAELHAFLRHRCPQPEESEDLLHEVFLRAVRQGTAFCQVAQPRAWLFQVARNLLADRFRLRREQVPLPEELSAEPPEAPAPIDTLSQCLPRVLSELSYDDRTALLFCDLEGGTQQALAEHLGISLAGAKSRVQRARQRLRERLVEACQVRFGPDGEVCCFTARPPL